MTKEDHVIIRAADGSFAIIAVPKGARRSDQIAYAPEGFRPGDEAFIKAVRDQQGQEHLLFDFHGKWMKGHEAEGTPETVLGRIKRGYLG